VTVAVPLRCVFRDLTPYREASHPAWCAPFDFDHHSCSLATPLSDVNPRYNVLCICEGIFENGHAQPTEKGQVPSIVL
jgi:hypothetical protein